MQPEFRTDRCWRLAPFVAAMLLLGGCASSSGPELTTAAASAGVDQRYPWNAYIQEASQRFNVPEPWIRAVMQRESGGRTHVNGKPITSNKGAMGLMQVMPETWAELSRRYGLGNNPYDPHDNVIAGTAYIREMYEIYGSPGFLAAYNAGPARYADHLNHRRTLPLETKNYMAAISPKIAGIMPAPGGADALMLAALPAVPRPAVAAAPLPLVVAAAPAPVVPVAPTPVVTVAPAPVFAPVTIAAAPPPVPHSAIASLPPAKPLPAAPAVAAVATAASVAVLPPTKPVQPFQIAAPSDSRASRELVAEAEVSPPSSSFRSLGRMPSETAAAGSRPTKQSNGLPVGWFVPVARVDG